MNIYIVGVGGVGSWLVPLIARFGHQITVFDGDVLEPKNLDRQLFSPSDIGKKKADAIAEKYGVLPISEYYSLGCVDHLPTDLVFCCVDNNAGRKEVLAAADMYGCDVIIAANEQWSAEARIYKPAWRNTPRDPRVASPEILSDKTRDPRSASIGCTGQAAVENPQLVTANYMAASCAGWLFANWYAWLPKQEDQTVADVLPYLHRANLTKLETVR